LQLDIVNQNYVSPENLDKQMAVTEIIAADFSSHGDWLSTVEMWDDKVINIDTFNDINIDTKNVIKYRHL
jgi:hypothetical protein